MDETTHAFLAAARAGEAVYVTDVRQKYQALPGESSFLLHAALEMVDGGLRVFRLRLPLFLAAGPDERRFAEDYFLAEMYNVLSSLGGRSLTLHDPAGREESAVLAKRFADEFGLGRSRRERAGYGRCVNVIERMLSSPHDAAPAGGKFSFSLSRQPAPPEREAARGARELAEVCRVSTTDMSGRIILGVDVGGTDIKLAMAVDGRMAFFKEYDWFPASFTHIDQLIDPIVALVRLLAYAALAHTGHDADGKLAAAIAPGMARDAGSEQILAAVATARKVLPGNPRIFDAIGMCFPDVVVGDKVVGGEVYKTRGIRNRPGADYEKEFAKLTDLDEALRGSVREGGAVGIVNDGPMAAFTAAVELAAVDPARARRGIYAQTLGTELGTGWVTGSGDIPDIPLEVYNFIVDLGSFPEREFEPDDLRSLNNFNTGLPGTLQKYTSQSGIFRLAMKLLPERHPELYRKLFERGFVAEQKADGATGLYVPTEPRDFRKPFLEFLMERCQSGGEPEVDGFFETVGAALAVAYVESEWILRTGAEEVVLFGRMVKKPRCFELMRKGAASVLPALRLAAADEGLAETPLMRELKASGEWTVAQFAQAVGAIYYGNYRRQR